MIEKLSLNFPLKSLTGNLKQMTDSNWSTVFREIKEIKGSFEFLCMTVLSNQSFNQSISINLSSFLAQTGPLKQVLAAMGINHTVMNSG